MRPWLLLAKLEVDFEEIRVPLFSEGYKIKLLQYSPAGQVPVLLDNDAVV